MIGRSDVRPGVDDAGLSLAGHIKGGPALCSEARTKTEHATPVSNMSTSKIAASDIKFVKAGDTYQVEG